jgi:hypothetical protein
MSDETYKTLEKNYILKIADAKAKILQRELDEFNPALALKSKADYGTPLIDAPISTASTTDATIRFPRRLAGLGGPEEVPGIWSWDEDGYVGDVTIPATAADRTVCSNLSDYANTRKVVFESQNENYKDYKADVSLCVLPKPLTVTVSPPTKTYDPATLEKFSNLRYTINGLANWHSSMANWPGTTQLLAISGETPNGNAGSDKLFSLTNIAWNNIASIEAIQGPIAINYILPKLGEILPHDLTATIEKAEFKGEVPPIVATPNAITYGDERYATLAPITLSSNNNGQWRWVDATEQPANPHDPAIYDEYKNAANSIEVPYPVEFILPQNIAMNYFVPGNNSAKLTIRKRSENHNVTSAEMNSACGSATGRLAIKTEDQNAAIWYNNASGVHEWDFIVSDMRYGDNEIRYEVQAEAFGIDYRGFEAYYHTRFFPFSKVARWIRDKSIAVSLDSSDIPEREFFRLYTFDLAKTNWYKGNEVVGTGYLFNVLPGSGDYNVELFATEIATGKKLAFYSCKSSSGAPPDYFTTTGTEPPSINLAASPLGAKVAAGGTTLTLNTPHGGKISIYTLKGELISAMHATENRTIVKLPATKGMYIVKLEAK